MESIAYKVGSKKSPIVINLKEYKGVKLIDIRKFYQDKENKENLLPTRKGLSLTSYQLGEVIQILNQNKNDINSFFSNGTLFESTSEIAIDFEQTIGRSFKLKFENDVTTVIFDESFKALYDSSSLGFLKNLLVQFYYSLTEVIEDQDDINIILDLLDKNLKKIQ
jgi:hypothetical protein